MSLEMRKTFVVMVLFVMCTGCMHYGRPYRSDYLRADPPTQLCEDHPKDLSSKSVWCPVPEAPFYLAFVEFDDFGELYDPGQLTRALSIIRRAKDKSPDRNAKVITFIHGWKNNASDASGNVWGFRDTLKDLAREYGGDDNEPIVGIYMGWRGAVTNVPVVKEFTFFNRKNAAIRIPGANLTEAINQIINFTKECIEDCGSDKPKGPGSLSVVVGHSFGGMVLERSVTQAIVGDILEQEAERRTCVRQQLDWRKNNQGAAHEQEIRTCQKREHGIQPRADLIALVNEAAPATEARQLLGFLRRHRVRLLVNGEPAPLILSITSVGDAATGVAFPIGQYPSKITKALRHYKDSTPAGKPLDIPIPDQSTYYIHTTGHLPPLFSHLVGKRQDPQIRQVLDPLGPEGENKYCYHSNVKNGQVYCVAPAPGAFNSSAYWVMQMPTEIVPDHSTIFRPVFSELLRFFVAKRVDVTQPYKPLKPAMIQQQAVTPEAHEQP